MNYVTHSAFFTKCPHKGEGRLRSGRTLGSLAAFHSKTKKPALFKNRAQRFHPVMYADTAKIIDRNKKHFAEA
ncbi:hypothetical protein FQP35_03340 [Bacillus subtilis]|nr:hypothetical protein EQH88_19640 [Bacillus subtilis]QAW47633.1 hypothetical protein ETK71_19420 [Bacillus subtilis]TVX90589.1 hypothetical protein FQP35_03340 [Bacillus subtilis]